MKNKEEDPMNENQDSTTEGGKDKKVILLDLSRTERAFEESESLWDIEIKKIENRLVDHMASLDEYEDENEIRKMPLLSIAIMGYPGSGKTSMLHTLVERLQGKSKPDALKNVYSLPVIKPNLVAEDDHFLYAFLAEALRQDRQVHTHEYDQDRETPFISRVQHKFQDVSEYLQVLNETGHKHEGDPLGRSLERLERHESGLMLIEKMAGFIDELADSLGGGLKNSIVLLPVDDADLSQEVLVSALDTCWRFIKHPRLVPIFTFTGRLAEELLRVNYDKKLSSGSSSEKIFETATSMMVTENMAIQHLGKLFPVRNRIKMGPAAARVQVAKYRPFKEVPEKEVSDLLEKASILLFGHVQALSGHSIRPPLRMVTLRRQIQIIDAIQGTGIEQFMEKTEEEKKKLKPWAVIFDMSTWSLLNAHRDVLKEIHLNLDDLYSWTPKGLRQVILGSILMQNKREMSKLHKQWRYRSEDRRSQIISLLAVNTFRPRMDEEPTSDDTPPIIQKWWKNYNKLDVSHLKEVSESFPALNGALWFLNLCIGFYLPQVISDWNKFPGNKDECMEAEQVTGVGWGLLSGPLHAVQEALKKKKVFASGMLFLEPEDFSKQIKDDNQNKMKRFFCHIWCYYGFRDEWPWAAISLWRGLGLMGKIIELCENYKRCSDVQINSIFEEKNQDESENNHYKILRQKIEETVKRHFESARVYSNLPKGKEIIKFQDLNTENWEYKEDAGNDQDPDDSTKKLIPKFAQAMMIWLKANYFVPKINMNGDEMNIVENRIFPMGRVKEEKEEKEKKDNENRESCFIRRLHGDNLMSIFWQDLEKAYFKRKLSDWTAVLILSQWKKLLSKYWDGCTPIKNLLESCPIWLDFKSHSLYEKEKPNFTWGQSNGFKEDEDMQKGSGIKRLNLKNYGLFCDEKPAKRKIEGSLTISNEKEKAESSSGNGNGPEAHVSMEENSETGG